LFQQPKIQEHCVPARGDKNICRLQIAMHDSTRMRCLQRVGDLNGEVQLHVIRQRPSRDAIAKRLAFQQFHRKKSLAILPADVVEPTSTRGSQVTGDFRSMAISPEGCAC
jgi:hypothetical protein